MKEGGNVKGYKAFSKGMICRGKQYQENTVYEENGADACCQAGSREGAGAVKQRKLQRPAAEVILADLDPGRYCAGDEIEIDALCDHGVPPLLILFYYICKLPSVIISCSKICWCFNAYNTPSNSCPTSGRVYITA